MKEPILIHIENEIIKTLLRKTYFHKDSVRKNERIINLLKCYSKASNYYGLGEGWFNDLLEPIRYDIISQDLYRVLRDNFVLEEYRGKERIIRTFMINPINPQIEENPLMTL